MNKCEVCDKPFVPVSNSAGRYCSQTCYLKAPRRGGPMARFLKRVQKQTGDKGCWIWTGAQSGTGYGLLYFEGRHQVASRVSWQLHRGPIPEGMNVCHDCPDGDNPLCVNPDHLFVGTQQENVEDAVKKGHKGGGTPGVRAKVTAADVRVIRERAKTESHTSIAPDFGLSRGAVDMIVSRKRWKNVA